MGRIRRPPVVFRVQVGVELAAEEAYRRFLRRRPKGRSWRRYYYSRRTGWVSAA